MIGLGTCHVGDFKLVFDNKDPARKNRTPSQLKRDYARRQDLKPSFGICEQANETTIDNITEVKDEVQIKEMKYDLKVEAGPNVKNHDIIEAIEVNYDGALDDQDISKDDPCRCINIHKLEPGPQHGTQNSKEKWVMYRIHVVNSAVASSVIEGWQLQKNFDDLAFCNAIRDEQQVRIQEVRKII